MYAQRQTLFERNVNKCARYRARTETSSRHTRKYYPCLHTKRHVAGTALYTRCDVTDDYVVAVPFNKDVTRTLHGRYTDVTRTLHGRYTDVTRTLHGRYTDVTRTLHGRYTDVTRTLHGRYTDVTRTLQGGQRVDYDLEIWPAHGVE
jgi:hypothetical protein